MAYIPPNPNGQSTMANSAPVTIASNQTAIPINTQDGAGNAIGSISVASGSLAGTNAEAVAQAATYFFASTNNSSSTQLAASATFTGVIETAFSQQSISLLLTSDQPITLTVNQYIDAGGTRLAQSNSFSVAAGAGFARSFPLNGNYVNVTAQNTGASTTTTFRLDAAYGTIPAANSLGDFPISLNDVGGTALTLGQKVAASSLPVVISTNQSDLPVASSPAAILQTPTSNSLAALNATVQYQAEGGAGIYLSLTNAAAATTAWSGTITFQYSLDGSTWNSFSVMPVASPANSAAVTTATANGLWFATLPSGTTQNQGSTVAYVRALASAWTSGTVYFFAQSSAVPNAKMLLPWTYSVTSGATITGPIESSGWSEFSIQLSAITTTVLSAQGTNDPSLTTWQTIPVIQGQAAATSAATMTAASTYRFSPAGYKWVRIQVTTTGTVLTVQGVTGTLGQQILLNSIGNDLGVTVNNTAAVTVSSGTVTTVSTVTADNLAASTVADIASAAITTTTTSAAVATTNISTAAFVVACTALSGTTPTLDVVVQESLDNVNWYDVYHFERITATGVWVSPTLRLNGQQIRYVRTVSGTTPSFTMSLNRQIRHVTAPRFVRVFDRAIAPNTLNSTTASVIMQGCSKVQIVQSSAAGATVAPVITLQGSEDNSNWYQLGTTAITVTGTASTNSMNAATSPMMPKYVRGIVTTAGTSAVLNYAALIGME
jgi:hypothetical protein